MSNFSHHSITLIVIRNKLAPNYIEWGCGWLKIVISLYSTFAWRIYVIYVNKLQDKLTRCKIVDNNKLWRLLLRRNKEVVPEIENFRSIEEAGIFPSIIFSTFSIFPSRSFLISLNKIRSSKSMKCFPTGFLSTTCFPIKLIFSSLCFCSSSASWWPENDKTTCRTLNTTWHFWY